MTKRAQWVQMPVEPADAWFALRHYERALGADMFRVFGSDEVIDVPIAALPEVICRRLAVDGRDRPTVKRALERLVAAGLVIAEGPRTHLLYSQRKHREWTANVRSTSGERHVNEQSSSGERSVNGRSSASETGPSAEDDSKDASQRERKKERKREGGNGADAPARPKRSAPPEQTALRGAIGDLAGKHGHEVTPPVSSKHMAAGVAKVKQLVARGCALREASERVAAGAYEHLAAGKASSFGWALHDAPLFTQPKLSVVSQASGAPLDW